MGCAFRVPARLTTAGRVERPQVERKIVMSSTFGFGGQPATAQKKTLNPVWFLVAIVAAVVLAGVWAYACAPKVHGAEPVGRPDPTGQGRYEQFGPELPHQGAQVVAKLPDGATECGSADELIGASVWNSTREGRAVFSKLTDKATIAVAGKRLFLCKCAKGYNELFLIERTSSQKPEAQVAKDEPTKPAAEPVAPALTQADIDKAVAAALAAQPKPAAIEAKGCAPELVERLIALSDKRNRKSDTSISCGGMIYNRWQFKHREGPGAPQVVTQTASGDPNAGDYYSAGLGWGGLAGLSGPALNSSTGGNYIYHSRTRVSGTPPAIGGMNLGTGDATIFNSGRTPTTTPPAIGGVTLTTGGGNGVYTAGSTPGAGNPGLTGTPLDSSTGR